MPPRLLAITALAAERIVCGRAVVLLELDHARVGEVLLEVEDVAHVRAAEAVDRLSVVADHREVAVPVGHRCAPPVAAPVLRRAAADQQLQQAVLRVVGVLVLVDEDVAERAPRSARAPPGSSSSRLTVRNSRSSKSIAFIRSRSRS